MHHFRYIVFLLYVCMSQAKGIKAQGNFPHSEAWQVHVADTSNYIYSPYPGICAGYFADLNSSLIKADWFSEPAKKRPVSSLTGKFTYEYVYRSRNAGSVTDKDIKQHTEIIELMWMAKGLYPIKISFRAHQSNSQWLPDFSDMGFQFDYSAWVRNYREKFIEKVRKQILKSSPLPSLQELLEREIDKYNQLNNWLKDPSILQKIIEERERIYRAFNNKLHVPGFESVPDLINHLNKVGSDSFSYPAPDHLDYTEAFEKNKLARDSLFSRISILRKNLDSMKVGLSQQIGKILSLANNSTDPGVWKRLAKEYNITIDPAIKSGKLLLVLEKLSLGRSSFNHSDLTANDIQLNGIQVKYSPSLHYAIAAGTINSGFPYFTDQERKHNNQFILLNSIGVGSKERLYVSFTTFQGRKNSILTSPSPTYNRFLTGYSIQTFYNLKGHTLINAEFAKSTKPAQANNIHQHDLNALLQLDDKTNSAVRLKFETTLNSNSEFSGFYRFAGKNFQSFSLYNNGNNQVAWQLRAAQFFSKRKISITAMLRQNNFTSPYTEKNYRSSTTFKSFSLNARLKKLPAVSIGYYPGVQLFRSADQRILEQLFNILHASLSHSYHLKKLYLSASFIMNRYTQLVTDSLPLVCSSNNYSVIHTLTSGRCYVNIGGAYTYQPNISYHTVDAGFSYRSKKLLRLALTAKYNRTSRGEVYFGKSCNAGIEINNLGTLEIQYEKMFLPAYNHSMYPADFGRLLWSKKF